MRDDIRLAHRPSAINSPCHRLGVKTEYKRWSARRNLLCRGGKLWDCENAEVHPCRIMCPGKDPGLCARA